MKKETLKHVQHRQARARSSLARRRTREYLRTRMLYGHPDLFKTRMASGREAANAARMTRREAFDLKQAFRDALSFGTGWMQSGSRVDIRDIYIAVDPAGHVDNRYPKA